MAIPTDTNSATDPAADYANAMLRYAEESRNAAVKTAGRVNFIAWIVGIFAALSLIGVLIGVVEIVHLTNVVTSPATSTSSDCYSQGGIDFSC